MSGESTPVDLIDDGLLWLINATVFHPRGFALARNSATGALSMMGDGSEPWVFADGPETDAKFQAAEALFARLRAQPPPPPPERPVLPNPVVPDNARKRDLS